MCIENNESCDLLIFTAGAQAFRKQIDGEDPGRYKQASRRRV